MSEMKVSYCSEKMFMSHRTVGYFFIHTHIYVVINICVYSIELYYEKVFSSVMP